MDEINKQYMEVAAQLGDIEFRMHVLAEHRKTLLAKASELNTSLTMLKQAKASEARRMATELKATSSETPNKEA